MKRALVCALGVVLAVGLAWLPQFFAHSVELLRSAETITGASVLFVAALAPFFVPSRSVLPQQFSMFPVSPGSVMFGVWSTLVFTWPGIFVSIWLAAQWVFSSQMRDHWQWTVPAWLLTLAVVSLSAVILATLAKKVSGFRFGVLIRALTLTLLLAAVPLLLFILGNNANTAETLATRMASALHVTPFGLVWAAPLGDLVSAISYSLPAVVVSGSSVFLLVILWGRVASNAMRSIDRPSAIPGAHAGLGWFARFPADAAGGIAARMITYWVRDPRYRVGLFAIPIAAFAMMGAFLIAGASAQAMALFPIPVMLLLLGWSQHNDISQDSTAVWIHVASAIRGRDDRRGRLAPVLTLGLPIVILGSSVSVLFFGDWHVFPAVFGMNVAVLASASGVSAVVSVLAPYPTTRPGDTPFAQPQWSGNGAGTAQVVSMLVALLLVAPPVIAGVWAISDGSLLFSLAVCLGALVYGSAVLIAGVRLGGVLFERRGPELIAVTQSFD